MHTLMMEHPKCRCVYEVLWPHHSVKFVAVTLVSRQKRARKGELASAYLYKYSSTTFKICGEAAHIYLMLSAGEHVSIASLSPTLFAFMWFSLGCDLPQHIVTNTCLLPSKSSTKLQLYILCRPQVNLYQLFVSIWCYLHSCDSPQAVICPGISRVYQGYGVKCMGF